MSGSSSTATLLSGDLGSGSGANPTGVGPDALREGSTLVTNPDGSTYYTGYVGSESEASDTFVQADDPTNGITIGQTDTQIADDNQIDGGLYGGEGGGEFRRVNVSTTQSPIPATTSGQTTTPVAAVAGLGPFEGDVPANFIVEDGTGYEDATSYVTIADATNYIRANIHAAPQWDSLDPNDQAQLLIWATRYIDQRTIWNGDRTVKTQALGWPRRWAEDRDGDWVPHNIVPQAVKAATVEMARYLIAQDRSIERPIDEFSKIEVDVIRLYRDETYRLAAVPPQISYILIGLGQIGSGNRSFGKIYRA